VGVIITPVVLQLATSQDIDVYVVDAKTPSVFLMSS
jgi:hypothetical protein